LKIITRGFGGIGQNSIVTLGYGPSVVQAVVDGIVEIFKPRQSGRRSSSYEHELEDVITVWAKLIEVNEIQPKHDIVGKQIVTPDESSTLNVMVEFVKSVVERLIRRVTVSFVRNKRS